MANRGNWAINHAVSHYEQSSIQNDDNNQNDKRAHVHSTYFSISASQMINSLPLKAHMPFVLFLLSRFFLWKVLFLVFVSGSVDVGTKIQFLTEMNGNIDAYIVLSVRVSLFDNH